ncbi:MAG: AbrB/MazE/SpoVT family DNA-binding domain-containing protein [Methyloprofundus sp.]|nr:AbrB/MazE/SpoVT family DNA-binding domain-containing protein [Methyloprofundus sp.]
MKTEVKKWGNSAAVRLPRSILAAAHLNAGTPISIEVKGRKIIIEEINVPKPKILKLLFSEHVLLKGMTPDLAHADELALIVDKEFGE